jgi:GNAT superfamily N-acetyltransferase
MEKAAIQIREAGVADAAAIARLLHDFNTEYEEETPPVAELTRHAERMLMEAILATCRTHDAGWIELNTGETDVAARGLYRKFGFTNEEGPEGASMLYYEREI